jgi:hypothetical protein
VSASDPSWQERERRERSAHAHTASPQRTCPKVCGPARGHGGGLPPSRGISAQAAAPISVPRPAVTTYAPSWPCPQQANRTPASLAMHGSSPSGVRACRHKLHTVRPLSSMTHRFGHRPSASLSSSVVLNSGSCFRDSPESSVPPSDGATKPRFPGELTGYPLWAKATQGCRVPLRPHDRDQRAEQRSDDDNGRTRIIAQGSFRNTGPSERPLSRMCLCQH